MQNIGHQKVGNRRESAKFEQGSNRLRGRDAFGKAFHSGRKITGGTDES
jgi:hypothetical protein